MITHAFRLTPGQDLKRGIEEYASKNILHGASVMTCVGGLSRAVLRMAGATPDKEDVRTFEGAYDIMLLAGTIASNGSHLKLAISDTEGKVIGGHLKEGTIVDPTAEIVLGEPENLTLVRRMDPQTGFKELTVEQ